MNPFLAFLSMLFFSTKVPKALLQFSKKGDETTEEEEIECENWNITNSTYPGTFA